MKRALINYVQQPKNDSLYTPAEAIIPLLSFLPVDWVWWEPTDDGGRSGITKVLRERGFKVIATSLDEGVDFFTSLPPRHFDAIITNPPYSLKNQFLKRAYEIGKPFAFLLPITTLEGRERGELFRKHGVEVLVLDRRTDFTGKKNCWFNVSWFCWKILPSPLLFAELGKLYKE